MSTDPSAGRRAEGGAEEGAGQERNKVMRRRRFLVAAAVAMCLAAGCARPVRAPAANYSYEIRSEGGFTKGQGSSIGAFADGNRLEIRDGRLTVNAKRYGPLMDGDSILIEKDGTVFVNGQKRDPE